MQIFTCQKQWNVCACVSRRVLSIQSIYQFTHTESQIVLFHFYGKKKKNYELWDY